MALLALGCDQTPSCDNLTCIYDSRTLESDGGLRDGGFCVFHERPVCCASAPEPLCGTYTDANNKTVSLQLGARDGGDCQRVLVQGVGCR